ncbi:K07112 K07112; uncharacterized protein [Candidatus Pelagibacterales bacterium]
MIAQRRTETPIVLFGLIFSLLFSYLTYSTIGLRHFLVLLIGIGLGFTLYKSAFGFTWGWRNFIEKKNSSGLRAQFLMLALAVIIFSFFIGKKSFFYDGLIVGAIAPVSLSVVIGSLMFGFAMQLGGGCGSGTLFTAGSGNVKMAITLIFFIIGSLAGTYHFIFWSSLPSLGTISLLNNYTVSNTLLIQLSLLTFLYVVVFTIDKKNNKSVNHNNIFKFTSSNLLRDPWPLFAGSVLLVFFSFLMLHAAGHPWSVTFSFGLWGAKIASLFGIDIASWDYWQLSYPAIALENSLLADPTTVSNLGIILGALIASALAGNFINQAPINKKLIYAAVIGGFFMGYGARLSFGCNIGALFGGIASGSMHGWVWFLFAFIGSYFGVKARKFFY